MLGCMGHPIIQTPNLDHMASKGVLFTQAYCTSPVCTPSRVSHYLGQWERKHGVNFNSGSAVTSEAWANSFPMQLKKHGYYLGWVGKNHVPVGPEGYSSGYLESVFDYWYGNHGHTKFYVKEAHDIYKNAKADTQIEVFLEGALNFLRPNPEFIQAAEPKLPERPLDQPFCLCVTFNLPHITGTGNMQLRSTDDSLYVSSYRNQFNEMPISPSYIRYWDIETPKVPEHIYNGRYIPDYDYVRRPQTLNELQVRKCQTVTGIDRFVGRIMEELENLRIADNTVIIYSTDHGTHHGEHGLGGKCFLYEEDLRIPLVIFDPRLPEQLQGQRREEFTLVPDLAPTVLELAQVPVPSSMQGESLLPLIYCEPVKWRNSFFCEQLLDTQNYPKSECVRTRDWKYIRYFERTEDPQQHRKRYRGTLDNYEDFLDASILGEIQPIYEELYDLQSDPYETINLAQNEKDGFKLKELREQLIHLAMKARGKS